MDCLSSFIERKIDQLIRRLRGIGSEYSKSEWDWKERQPVWEKERKSDDNESWMAVKKAGSRKRKLLGRKDQMKRGCRASGAAEHEQKSVSDSLVLLSPAPGHSYTSESRLSVSLFPRAIG